MNNTPQHHILAFFKRQKRMPSYREIADILGYKSKNAAYKLVDKLETQGFLSRDSQGKILPGQLFNSIKILGSVQAGFPTHAEETGLDTMNIDDFMIENKEGSYMLTVRGDSMKDAGIHEGDMVIVLRTEKAKVGDIVIAEIDGEWTMKYLEKDTAGIYFLRPAHEGYPDMYPSDDLKIGGVVKGVLRKY